MRSYVYLEGMSQSRLILPKLLSRWTFSNGASAQSPLGELLCQSAISQSLKFATPTPTVNSTSAVSIAVRRPSGGEQLIAVSIIDGVKASLLTNVGIRKPPIEELERGKEPGVVKVGRI